MEDGWHKLANCRDSPVDLFFPEKVNLRSPRLLKALMVCSDCQVRGQCMDYALHHDLLGIWGGTTENDRKRIKDRYTRTRAPMNLAYRPLVG